MGVYREPYKKDPDQRGAAWQKVSANGDYLSISIIDDDGVENHYVAFRNKFKKKENHPDWIIKRSKPRGQESIPTKKDDIEDDSIPF